MTLPVATYYVKNGNTLGFVYAEQPGLFNVLAGKPQLGGDDWKDGFVGLSPLDKLVPATIADFDYFRVCHKGHLPEPVEPVTDEDVVEDEEVDNPLDLDNVSWNDGWDSGSRA